MMLLRECVRPVGKRVLRARRVVWSTGGNVLRDSERVLTTSSRTTQLSQQSPFHPVPLIHYVTFTVVGSISAYAAAIIVDAEVNHANVNVSKEARRDQAQTTVYSMIAMNCLIYGAWRVPITSAYHHPVRAVLAKYFISSSYMHPLALLGTNTALFSQSD